MAVQLKENGMESAGNCSRLQDIREDAKAMRLRGKDSCQKGLEEIR